ncbi:TPA: hypothetical protein NJ327_004543 [Vibrio parahaemolyticus]|nr:hypothetical protein [Vibrio parahaemolyticus]
MNLNSFWRMEYVNDPYLMHLSLDELSYRARYLIESLTTLELNGKIGLRNIEQEPGRDLMRKFTHVLQDLDMRKQNFPAMFMQGASIPKAMLGHEKRLMALNNLAINKKPHLVKFGKKEYLEQYSFKVSLASSFSDPSLNAAQMDDEMKAIYTPHPSEVKMTTMDGEDIQGVQSIILTFEATQDYYIFCSSAGFDVRLFGDFEADACLFIYDSHRFAEDLHKAVSTKVRVEDYGYKNVTYVDPVRPKKGNPPPVEFHKHIEYLYQNEYRHVFVPYVSENKPRDLFLSIPEASSYTELVCL